MELRHLRYFVAVAEVENVSLAAKRLHVSQPPLSRQIHQLEDELGVALFERTPKSLRLTAAGRVFAREAKQILRQVDQAAEAARTAVAQPLRSLDIAYAPSLTVEILPRLLRHLHQRFPEARIKLHDASTAHMLKGLHDGSLDLALVVHPGKAALGRLPFHELAHHPACAVLPIDHPLAHTDSIEIRQLVHEPVIAFTRADYPEYHRWLKTIYQPTRSRPRIVQEHDSITSLIAAIEAGHGIGFGAEDFKAYAGDRLTVRPLAPSAPPIHVGIVPGTRLRPDQADACLQGLAPSQGLSHDQRA